MTFPAHDVPYLVPDHVKVHENGGAATIEAGAEFVFEQDAGFAVGKVGVETGSLTATGTADDPIVFRGRGDSSGYWDGLAFNGSQSLDNKLEHVTISGGGGADSAGNLSLAACCGETVTATLDNVTFEKCGEGGGLHFVASTGLKTRVKGCSGLKANSCSPEVTGWDMVSTFSDLQSEVCE